MEAEGNRTLEELGKGHGSALAIRQMFACAREGCCSCRVFAPALDRALGFIASCVPIRADDLQCEFANAGLESYWLPPKVIRQAALFLSRSPVFDTVVLERVELVVEQEMVRAPKTIAQVARRIALASGNHHQSRMWAARRRAQLGCEVDPALVRVTLKPWAVFNGGQPAKLVPLGAGFAIRVAQHD